MVRKRAAGKSITGTSRFFGYFVATVLWAAVSQFYIDALIVDIQVSELDLTAQEVEVLKSEGAIGSSITRVATIAIVLLGPMAVGVIFLNWRRTWALSCAVAFSLWALFVVWVRGGDIVFQTGFALRVVGPLIVLPALVILALRRAKASRIIAATILASGLTYALCALFILLRAIESSVVASALRYAVVPGHATAAAALFMAGIWGGFIVKAIPYYPRALSFVRIPLEAAIVASGIAVVVLTGSRGPFVATAIGVATYLFLSTKRRPILTFTMVTVALIGAVPIITGAGPAEGALEYFDNRAGHDFTTGRIDIWKEELTSMNSASYLLLGGGGVDKASHNSLIGTYVEYGAISLLIFVLLQVLLFHQSVKALIRASGHREAEVHRRLLAVQVAAFSYGLFENFFYLNSGAVMFLYYFSFGLQIATMKKNILVNNRRHKVFSLQPS